MPTRRQLGVLHPMRRALQSGRSSGLVHMFARCLQYRRPPHCEASLTRACIAWTAACAWSRPSLSARLLSSWNAASRIVAARSQSRASSRFSPCEDTLAAGHVTVSDGRRLA